MCSCCAVTASTKCSYLYHLHLICTSDRWLFRVWRQDAPSVCAYCKLSMQSCCCLPMCMGTALCIRSRALSLVGLPLVLVLMRPDKELLKPVTCSGKRCSMNMAGLDACAVHAACGTAAVACRQITGAFCILQTRLLLPRIRLPTCMLEETSCRTFASSVASSRFLLRLLSEILHT
jgi:hypothetical protein